MSEKYYLKNSNGNIQIKFLDDDRHVVENPILNEVDHKFIKNYNNNFLFEGTFNIVGTSKFIQLIYQCKPEGNWFGGMFEYSWKENFSGYCVEKVK